MKPRVLVWLAVCVGLVLALSVSAVSGWALGAVVVAALMLAVPLSVNRFRRERNLVRALWGALTTR